MEYKNEMLNLIGTKYKAQGKRKDICTIIDVHFTYNSKNELIKTSFVSTHDFLGQIITNYEVPYSNIIRGKI